jgi:hypothetical protein
MSGSGSGRRNLVPRAGGAIAQAAERAVQLERNAGPNLGLPHNTMGEAFVRSSPQVTEELA